MAEVQTNAASTAQQEPAPSKPPLSDKDFRFYNSLADKMEYFHSHFRDMWKVMWDACESGRRPKNMSLRQFLNHAEDFVRYLETHHNIEERVVYPHLAPRLKHFDPKNGALVVQHKEIHRGMDALDAYVKECKTGRTDFSLAVLREKLEPWGDVLWVHLDEEVAALGAEHMYKVFTKEEFSRIPM
jgi:hemerythrin-like domain-containing protein